ALVTRALLHLGDGKSQAAHDALEQALELAAPQDAVWPVTRDERITTLLEDHGTWGTRHEGFVARLLAALADGPAVDVLSPREQEVLAHLRTDMTTAEIADALFVSVNTVKTHLRAIYRKQTRGERPAGGGARQGADLPRPTSLTAGHRPPPDIADGGAPASSGRADARGIGALAAGAERGQSRPRRIVVACGRSRRVTTTSRWTNGPAARASPAPRCSARVSMSSGRWGRAAPSSVRSASVTVGVSNAFVHRERTPRCTSAGAGAETTSHSPCRCPSRASWTTRLRTARSTGEVVSGGQR